MPIRGCLIALMAMMRREVIRVVRIWPQTLLPPVITMVLYFVIFGNLIGPRIGVMQGVSYINYIIPGLIMMSIITNAYANVVSSFFGAKFQSHIEEMLVSPMPSAIILWGFIAGGILRGLAVGGLVMGVATCFADFQVQHPWVVMGIGLLTAVLFSLAGIINGIYANKFDDIAIIPTFVLTPLTYLGGVFYSIDVLSEFWQLLMRLNPIFYLVNGFRYGMLGRADVSIFQAFIILIGFVVLLYLFSLWLINKGIGTRG